MTKKCVICGSLFEAKTDRAKYCCKKCANHSRFNRTREQIQEYYEKLKVEVLHLYKLGLNDKQIAQELGISPSCASNKRKELGLIQQRTNQRLKKQKPLLKDQKRICKRCEAEFTPIRVNQLFCCPECEKKNNHQRNDIKRKRLERRRKVDDISVDDVFKKYKGICYLCGGKCDYQSVKIVNGIPHPLGDYPSRDHVIPLSRGGLHTWDNVRLAHIKCNSRKGTNYG